ncbi:MAG: hypothetical protein ACREMT_06210 [Vulcanimicrobiaceae bacterium]
MAQLHAQRRLLFQISTHVCDLSDRLGEVLQWRQHASTLVAANRQLFAVLEAERALRVEMQRERDLWRTRCIVRGDYHDPLAVNQR